MALTATEYRRGGMNGGVTDIDGRMIVVTGGIADSRHYTGSVAAPGVTTTVAGPSTALAAGVYSVEGTALLTATAETNLVNLRLRLNSVGLANGAMIPTITGAVVPFLFPRVTVPASGVLDVASQAAATAGSIYTVRFCVTQVE